MARWLRGAVAETDSDAAGAAPTPTSVVVGALVVTEERLLDVASAAVAAARTVAGAGASTAATAVTSVVPTAVRTAASDAVIALGQRARAATNDGADEAATLARAIAGRAVHEPAVLRLVEDVVDQIQSHVLDAILPGVLERLAADSEAVRAIVQGQSRGMVDELARVGRSRAVQGDEAVDRVVDRLLGRHHAPRRAPVPNPAAPILPAPPAPI